MKSKNELINEDLEVLDFKSNTMNGVHLPSGLEPTDPTEAYGINCGVKTKEELLDSDILLSVRNLKQFFFFGKGPNKTKLKAVNNISFDIKKGECFGVVGESGCGKTTTGRSIIKLYDITSGAVYYRGYRISAGTRWNEKEIKYTKIRLKDFIAAENQKLKEQIAALDSTAAGYSDKVNELKRESQSTILDKKNESATICSAQKNKIKQIKYDNKHVNKKLVNEIQMIFQDPVDSLDPRMTVEDIIQEGLIIQGFTDKVENHKKVVEILNKVGLVEEHASRYPHEFSGGQRQRIGIARAIIMNPKLLICDEPISALDVSIRAQVINLLNDLKEEFGLTIMFIAHDLSVVKYFCDKIAVMYFGKIVEIASSDSLFRNPLHPYTQSLLSAIPKPNPISEKSRTRIVYDATKAHDYSVDKPDLREVEPGHSVYCNLAELAEYKKIVAANSKIKKEVKSVEKAEEKVVKPQSAPAAKPASAPKAATTPKASSTTKTVKTTTTTTTTKKVVKKDDTK